MGWCSGSRIAEDLWEIIKEYIPEDKKLPVAKIIYELFCDYDADCWTFEEGTLAALADPQAMEED